MRTSEALHAAGHVTGHPAGTDRPRRPGAGRRLVEQHRRAAAAGLVERDDQLDAAPRGRRRAGRQPVQADLGAGRQHERREPGDRGRRAPPTRARLDRYLGHADPQALDAQPGHARAAPSAGAGSGPKRSSHSALDVVDLLGAVATAASRR